MPHNNQTAHLQTTGSLTVNAPQGMTLEGAQLHSQTQKLTLNTPTLITRDLNTWDRSRQKTLGTSINPGSFFPCIPEVQGETRTTKGHIRAGTNINPQDAHVITHQRTRRTDLFIPVVNLEVLKRDLDLIQRTLFPERESQSNTPPSSPPPPVLSREEYIEQGGDPELLELLAHDEVVQRVLEDLRQTAEALRDPMRSQPRPEERQAMRQGVEEVVTYLETHLQQNHQPLIQTLISIIFPSAHAQEVDPEEPINLRSIRDETAIRPTPRPDTPIRPTPRPGSQPPEIDDLPIEPCPGIELLIGGVLGLGLRGLAVGFRALWTMGGTAVVTQQARRLPQTSKDVARYFRNQSLQRKQAKIRQRFARRDNITTEQAQTVGFIGRNPRRAKINSEGNLEAYTDLHMGDRTPKDIFNELKTQVESSRGPSIAGEETLFRRGTNIEIGKFVRFSDGSRVQLRYQGSSGAPKIEVNNNITGIYEKIKLIR